MVAIMTSTLTKKIFKACFLNLNSNTWTPFNVNLRLSRNKSTKTFKAAVLKEAGKDLVLEDKKSVSVKRNQVKILVKYCSVNIIDVKKFNDKNLELPFIPGYELSGDVLEIGKDITPEHVMVGERVAALSLSNHGGFAEECVVNIDDVWRLPSNIEYKDAAVLVCGHSTALYTFSKLCKPKKDDFVVISAGAAGLGLAAIDVAANAFNLKTLAVTDTEDRTELMRERGAFSTLKFTESKIKKDILSHTNQKGADIIYDGVGDYMFKALGECLAPNGTIFHAAPVFGDSIPVPPSNTLMMLVNLHTLRDQNLKLYRQIVNDTLELADKSVISSHVSERFSLKDVNKAIKYIYEKKCTGKVVIEVND